MSATATLVRRPSRRRLARGAIIRRIALSAFSALASWRKPTIALIVNHGEDHRGIEAMAERPGRGRRRQKEVDQGVVELRQEAPDGMGTGRRGQLVGTVGLEASCRLMR